MTRENVVFLMQSREYGSRENYRHNLKVLQSIVLNTTSCYSLTWQTKSNKNISYEEGKIYMENYSKTYSVYGSKNRPTFICKNSINPSSKKITALIAATSLSKVLTWKDSRPSFFALQKDGWLKRHDLSTGTLLESVYVSPEYKFKEIDWYEEQKSIQLYRGSFNKQDRKVTAALFTVFPLKVICVLEIYDSVFGAPVADTQLIDQLLIVGLQNNIVRIYDLEKIIKENKLFDMKLKKHCPNVDRVVGLYPDGLPVNVKAKGKQTILFEVKCAERKLTIGGFPWHYIMTPPGYKGIYHIRHLNNHCLAKNGILDGEELTTEHDPERAMFHFDDSGNIIHIGATYFRTLEITDSHHKAREEETQNKASHQLRELYYVSVGKRNSRDVTRTNKWGRKVKAFQGSVHEKTIENFGYENELDLLYVVVTEDSGMDCGQHTAQVHLYENQTGHLAKIIKLEEPWLMSSHHEVSLDATTLVHISREQSRHCCYMYQLDRPYEKG